MALFKLRKLSTIAANIRAPAGHLSLHSARQWTQSYSHVAVRCSASVCGWCLAWVVCVSGFLVSSFNAFSLSLFSHSESPTHTQLSPFFFHGFLSPFSMEFIVNLVLSMSVTLYFRMHFLFICTNYDCHLSWVNVLPMFVLVSTFFYSSSILVSPAFWSFFSFCFVGFDDVIDTTCCVYPQFLYHFKSLRWIWLCFPAIFTSFFLAWPWFFILLLLFLL